MNKNFSQKTKEEIFERDEYQCQICGRQRMLERTPHHVFYRSELHREIVRSAHNGVTLCIQCHSSVTNPTPENSGKVYDAKLKREAMNRFNGTISEKDWRELEDIYRKRHGAL